MKRILSLILATMLILALPACAQTTDMSGDWYFTAVEVGGLLYPPEAYEVLPPQGITLTQRGAYILDNYGISTADNAQWKFDGETLTIFNDEYSADLSWDGECLRYTDDTEYMHYDSENPYIQTLIFTRTDAPQAYFTPGACIEAEAEDFLGSWECFSVNLDGTMYYTEALDLSYTLAVDEKRAQLNRYNGFNDVTQDHRWKLEDGALCAGDESYLLTEDGFLAWPTDVDGLGATIYFRRSAQAVPMRQVYETAHILSGATAQHYMGRWQLFAARSGDSWAMNLQEYSVFFEIGGSEGDMYIEAGLTDEYENIRGTCRMDGNLLRGEIEGEEYVFAVLDDGVMMVEYFTEDGSILAYFTPFRPHLPVE